MKVTQDGAVAYPASLSEYVSSIKIRSAAFSIHSCIIRKEMNEIKCSISSITFFSGSISQNKHMVFKPVDWDRVQEDKEKKKRTVLEYVRHQCTDSSPNQDFRDIALALQKGDKLLIKCLKGGLTNYSYKLYLSSSPCTALFAKLSFSHAIPFPDIHFDVERASNEFEIMKTFAKIAPGCVAIPYLCVSIDDMKLLVTQWCSADEQLAKQMIDGCVDFRVATKLARAIASLHCADFDPNFNGHAREFMQTLSSGVGQMLHTLASDNDTEDRTVSFARKFEKELCCTISESMTNDHHNIDCLMHGDFHVFNIIVEQKPDVPITLNNFGRDGSMEICDWEISFPGAIGKDIGHFHPFPLACVLAHAINGHMEAAYAILGYLNLFWDEYCNAMITQGGKDNEFMSKAFRNSLGYCGALLLFYYKHEAHIDLLPVEQNSANYLTIKDAMGVLGLKFMRWGFGGYDYGLTLIELRSKYKEAIMNELEHVSAANPNKGLENHLPYGVKRSA